jgi:hypothetical protein
MAEVDIDTALDWRGRAVVDREGEKIGMLREIYLDESDRPAWGSVHTGLFGLRQTLVPLTEARPVEEQVQLPYRREQVNEAPSIDPDVQLTADEEEQLYRHYAAADEPPAAVRLDRTGDDAMTRSEEEVTIGTRRRVRGRARLKKYVVTDYVEKKIPVRREEVRLEQEPAGDDAPPTEPSSH